MVLFEQVSAKCIAHHPAFLPLWVSIERWALWRIACRDLANIYKKPGSLVDLKAKRIADKAWVRDDRVTVDSLHRGHCGIYNVQFTMKKLFFEVLTTMTLSKLSFYAVNPLRLFSSSKINVPRRQRAREQDRQIPTTKRVSSSHRPIIRIQNHGIDKDNITATRAPSHGWVNSEELYSFAENKIPTR